MTKAYLLPRDNEELSARMLESGLEAARTSLDEYVKDAGSPQILAASSGIAVELVLKSLLMAKSEALILDARPSDDALKSIAGLRTCGPTLDFPTCGFADLLKRLKWCWPDFPHAESARKLYDERNAAVHAGVIGRAEDLVGVSVMVKILEWVRTGPIREGDVGPSEADFWSPYVDLVRRLLADWEDRVWVRVSGLLARAKQNYEERYADLSELQRTPLFHTLTEQQFRFMADQAEGPPEVFDRATCPACNNTGIRRSDIIDVDFREDFDGLKPIGGSVRREAHPAEFNCPICGLSLDSLELDATNLSAVEDLDWLSI